MNKKFTEHVRYPFDMEINKISAKLPIWFGPADPWRNQSFFNRQKAYASSYVKYGISLGTWAGRFIAL